MKPALHGKNQLSLKPAINKFAGMGFGRGKRKIRNVPVIK